MKKTAIFVAFFVALMTLSGCAQKTSGNTNNPAGNASAGNGAAAGSLAGRMPDFGQPDRQPDISGIVQSITGNEVTILKIDRPARNSDGSGPADSQTQNTDNNNRPAGIPGVGGTGGRGGFVAGGGGGGRFVAGGGGGGPEGAGGQNGGNFDRTAMLEQLKAMSSGSETVTVPVGIRMLKPDTTTTGTAQARDRNMTEANLGDIQADKMVSIWLNTDITDRNIADFVLITR